jgi:hypothetical protein
MFFLFLFLLSYVPITLAFNVTICDCSNSQKQQIFKFSEQCNVPLTPHPILYDYSIFTDHPESINFPAYICSRWKKQLIIQSSILILLSFTERDKTFPIDTSEKECRDLVMRKKCESYDMVHDRQSGENGERTWQYEKEPSGPRSWWLGGITYETTNCLLKEITLKKYCDEESCYILTPYGKVTSTGGFYSHNHNTIVWEKSWETINKARLRKVESGIGEVVQIKTESDVVEMRLSDRKKEINFHLQLPASMKNDSGSLWYEYKIKNMPGVSALIKPSNSNRSANVSSKQKSVISADEIEINSAAHSQFTMDHEVENENILAGRIDLVNCELQKSKHRQAIIAAQYNGWLGAEILGLSKCTKLHAIGTIVQSIQCEIKNVSFSTHVTACGHQPVYKSNYTISKTGWELVDYNSCYWTANWVNFNGIPHSFNNGTWQPLEYVSISPQVPLHHTFKYVDDTASSFVTHINPAYDMITIDHVNVVADLVAAINEHHQPGVPSPVFVKPDQLSHLNSISMMGSAWSTFLIVVFVIIAIVLIAIGIYFRKTIYIVISCLFTPLRLVFRFIGTQFSVCFYFLKKKKNDNISLSNIRMSDPEKSNGESNLLKKTQGYVTPSAPSHDKIYQDSDSQSSSPLKTESIYPNIFYVTEEEINNQPSVTIH